MKKIILTILISLSLFSCKKEETITIDDTIPANALLMYCSAYNNLNSNISKNISDLKSNFVYNENKRIYIFTSNSNGKAFLYRINNTGEDEIIIEYGDSINTADITTLSTVMEDVSAQLDVTEITDIILSSHGGSWLPDNTTVSALSVEAWSSGYENFISFNSFGYDDSDTSIRMNIDDLSGLFENYNLQTIIFDACYMGSIEVFYQLRNSAKYILASPCEVLSDGMNYPDMTKYLTRESSAENLNLIALETYEMYSSYQEEDQTLALTVVDCEKLDDFAQFVKEISDKYSEYSTLATPDIRYDGVSTRYAYDYKMYLENLIELGGGTEYDELQSYWEEVFPYRYATEYLFNYMPMAETGGVAGYIYRSSVTTSVNNFYLSLDWGQLLMN